MAARIVTWNREYFGIALVGLFVLAASAQADTITTKSGLTFRKAKVSRIDADGIQVTYPEGVVKVPFDELSAAQKAKYGYGAAKIAAAATHLQQEKEAQLKQTLEKEMQDQQEARSRYDEEERIRQEQARQQEQALAAMRTKNLARDSLEIIASALLVAGTFLAGVAVYFLPAWIGRKKRNSRAIFVLNLIGAWTIIGWVAALAWAFTKDPVLDIELAHRRKLPGKLEDQSSGTVD